MILWEYTWERVRSTFDVDWVGYRRFFSSSWCSDLSEVPITRSLFVLRAASLLWLLPEGTTENCWSFRISLRDSLTALVFFPDRKFWSNKGVSTIRFSPSCSSLRYLSLQVPIREALFSVWCKQHMGGCWCSSRSSWEQQSKIRGLWAVAWTRFLKAGMRGRNKQLGSTIL